MPGPLGATPTKKSRQTASPLPDGTPMLSSACQESPAQQLRGSLPLLVGFPRRCLPTGLCMVEGLLKTLPPPQCGQTH